MPMACMMSCEKGGEEHVIYHVNMNDTNRNFLNLILLILVY